MFTAKEKRECAERELKMRRRVYARWTEEAKMSPHRAEREIALMAEIVEDYRILEEGERLI